MGWVLETYGTNKNRLLPAMFILYYIILYYIILYYIILYYIILYYIILCYIILYLSKNLKISCNFKALPTAYKILLSYSLKMDARKPQYVAAVFFN